MKVKDLREMLDRSFLRDKDEAEVVISVSVPSIGPTAVSNVRHAGFGFDWNKGQFIISPETPLVPRSEKQHLWQLSLDFIWGLAGDTNHRMGKDRPTELGKRARRILYRANITLPKEPAYDEFDKTLK